MKRVKSTSHRYGLATAAALVGIAILSPLQGTRAASISDQATPQPATPQPATPQQVDAAIVKAKAYIYKQMKGNNWELSAARDPKMRGWELTGGQFGESTALATYALLAAGENPQDPRILRAIDYLLKTDIIGTYALSFRCQVWLNIPRTDAIKAAIEKDAKLLLALRRTRGPEKGLYHYIPAPPSATDTDHSPSEFGVFGLWACSEIPELVPDSFWTETDATWRQDQGDDGSWSYLDRSGSTDSKGSVMRGNASMTAAGIDTLFLTQEFRFRGRGFTCSGNIVDKNIDLGFKWLADYFSKGAKGINPYTLYGLERIGVASGYKYFGDTNWYTYGATHLVHEQQADGSFKPDQTSPGLLNTCFALLFLSRGRSAVMMNKLNYAAANQLATWNERPRDCPNIVRWVGKETENDLNWQITTLASPVEEWHDSPILYITGDQSLKFSDFEKQKLKSYVEQGGLIVGNADCGKPDFADSFRQLGKEIFSDYEFKPLSITSTLLHDEQYDASKWRRPVSILAMDNGARELMILLPDADASKAWQFQQTAGHEELFEFAADLFLYSVDKDNLTAKGETYIVTPDPAVPSTATINIQRITYGGNADPEPGGWRRLSAILHNGDHIDLNVTLTPPEHLTGKTIAHLTGTGPFKLNDAAIASIKSFIQAGGTLVVDAAGGNSEFVESAERLLKAIFPEDVDQLKKPLPLTSPLYSTGGPLDEVMYRTAAHKASAALKGPQLRGITRDGRLVCIFSREDLSVGLVGQAVDGVVGYTPASAASLMRKIILYATGTKSIASGIADAGTPAVLKKPTTTPAVK